MVCLCVMANQFMADFQVPKNQAARKLMEQSGSLQLPYQLPWLPVFLEISHQGTYVPEETKNPGSHDMRSQAYGRFKST